MSSLSLQLMFNNISDLFEQEKRDSQLQINVQQKKIK